MKAENIISEKWLERTLNQRVKAMGGLSFKFTSPNMTGVPDRIILFFGRVVFAEIKTTGKNLTPRQRIVKKQLEDQGFKYFVIDDKASLFKCLKYLSDLCLMHQIYISTKE